MLATKTKRSIFAAAAGLSVIALALTGCAPGGVSDGKVTLSYLIDNQDNTLATAKQLVADFKKVEPNITIKLETRPAGTDGDNLVKTKLATGDMADVFLYNTGSLFQAIAPAQNLVPLTDEPFMKNVAEGYQQVVTVDGQAYGAPIGTVMGGGIVYNKRVYAELGLKVPKTWKEFISNSEAIKAAGKVAVIETFKDTWTSQLLVLGDFANVSAKDPAWAEKYTNNKAKYATDPAAAAGFEHLAEVFNKGLMNDNFGSATLDDGLALLASGDGVQYPMLTFVGQTIQANYPKAIDDIGVFAIPGDNASSNPLTTWYPLGVYIPKSTTGAKLDAAKKWAAFIASPAGCASQTASGALTGPYLVKGCDLGDNIPSYVKDLKAFVDANNTGAALEFLSPIKGPSLEQITVAVGSGLTSPADGAAQYDADVVKQAQQLGLKGW